MANIWREPIFDRTSHDVAFAIQQIEAWKKSHSHAADVKVDSDKVTVTTDGEAYVEGDVAVINPLGNVKLENNVLVMELGVVYDLKGCLNLSDITRIEDNIECLSNLLISYRFPVVTNSKEWTAAGLPNADDMKRIAANIRSLFSGFYTPYGAVELPDAMLSYEDINAIEKNLYLLKQTITMMESAFIKSGKTYKSGATLRLPIRR